MDMRGGGTKLRMGRSSQRAACGADEGCELKKVHAIKEIKGALCVPALKRCNNS